MEFSQLRTLIHVAELGSLSKAADRMRIAQPALSRQIRLLEGELGTRLFVRHGRGMVLTDQGRSVLAHAARVMRELAEIRADVAGADAPFMGRVSVGLPPTVADRISVPLVGAFRGHPEVTPRLVSAYTGHLLDWLHRDELDLAILYDPQSSRSLRTTLLLTEHLHVVGPADAGLVPGEPVRFRLLGDRPLLLPSSRHGLRRIVEQCASEVAVGLRVVAEADAFGTLKDLVRHAYGWTILPLASVAVEVGAGVLSAAPLVEPIPERRLVLAYPTDRPVSRLVRFAGETVTRLFRAEADAAR